MAAMGDRLHPASSSGLSPGNVRSRALESLRAIRPRMTVIADEEGLKPFETDAFIAHRETP
ncbi:MAG TPA: hypothetical protein VHP62_02320, partial [Usitatibacter sp.]|nr:hypothetical protein [Usitatibacter sp.]